MGESWTTNSTNDDEGYVYRRFGPTPWRGVPIFWETSEWWQELARIYQAEGYEAAEEWLCRSRR